MKILVVGNYFYPEHTGGVETVSYNLVNYYREFGHIVHWVAADVPPNFRSAGKGDVPIRSWNITEEKLGFPSPIPFVNYLPRLLSNIKWCDIVHLQDSLYLINIITFIISKLLKKPVLITQYAKVIPYKQLYKRILQIVAYSVVGRVMFSFADKVVFITTNVRDGMNDFISNRKLDVVPLGVNTDFFSPVSASERENLRKEIANNALIPVVLFVGRMVERKGVYLIRPLIEKHKEWHWVMVGRPDDFNPGEWGLSNLTYFHHTNEENLRNLYAIADLLIHPSVGEGFTLIASESMACGTPVVISEESLREIDNRDHRLFFSVTPDTVNIENVLQHALSDISRLNELRMSVREYALTRLSWRKVSEHYLKILSELSS